MFKFDLKSVLLMSMSSEKPIHRYKRFQLGKSCYAVHFNLSGSSLIIRQVKKTKRSQSKHFVKKPISNASVLQIRDCHPMGNDNRTFLEDECQLEPDIAESIEPTATYGSTKTRTRPHNASHTSCNCINSRTQAQALARNIGTDTSDLVDYLPKEQQTVNKIFDSSASQTNALNSGSQSSQTRIRMNNKATQSNDASRWVHSTGIQTDCTTNGRYCQEDILNKIALTLVNHGSILQSNVVLVEHLIEATALRSADICYVVSFSRKIDSRPKREWLPSIGTLRLRCKNRWRYHNQLRHPLRCTGTDDKAIQTEVIHSDVQTQTNKRRIWF